MHLRAPASALAVAIVSVACMSTVTPVKQTPSPSLTTLQLACRLPISAPHAGAGGFVNFPAATFTADASSLDSYDSALSKWVPVPRSAISPDGRRYASVENRPDPFINVVDVASGGVSTTEIISVWNVATPARLDISAMSLLAFEPAGIYLTKTPAAPGATQHGLVLFNPDTLAYQDPAPGADGSRTYVAVHGGIAYSANRGALDVVPLTSGGGLASIAIPGSTLDILGFDSAGHPLVAATSADAYRVFAGSTAIFSGAPGDPDQPTGPAVGDGNGAWFGSASGVVWYYPGGGRPLERVAVAPFQPATVAGPCS